MANYTEPFIGPPDATKMSPYSHDDFEKGSLAIAGESTHYVRIALTTNRNIRRKDESELCATPSVVVIPPPLVIRHKRALKISTNWWISSVPQGSVFYEKPGYVLNEDKYPMPWVEMEPMDFRAHPGND